MYNNKHMQEIFTITSDLFTQMGEHTGEISVVIAIVVVFILGVTVLNTLKGE